MTEIPQLPQVPLLSDGRKKITNEVMSRVDPFGWGPAVFGSTMRAAARPTEVAAATARFLASTGAIPAAALQVMRGETPNAPVEIPARDRRFADPTWEQNASFFALRQMYLAACQYADDLVKAGRGGGLDDEKTALVVSLMQDALAPTNNAFTNPDVLITALRTGGRSLYDGAKYAMEDLRERGGRPLKVDRTRFKLGKDLAATPGKVVYRNDLIELIQYAPMTDEVHEIPLLASPPWINKYYVMDLAPERSFFEWAVKHGRTTFAISYRDPDATMSDLTMDSYLEMGPLAALDAVQSITGADKVDVASLCLGGAMGAMTAAYLGDESDVLGSFTMLNTMLDYAEPGIMSTMVDPTSLERLDVKMSKSGYLDGGEMSLTFDLLRANDLIFNYVVSRWLKGEAPADFDILAWNDDSTRMPAAMHSAYVKSLYQNNELAKGEYSIGGRTIDLADIDNDTYVVGAINDHIVPWQASYKSAHYLGGKVRYVLSSGGHIAGIVNPPSPKAWYETTDPIAGKDFPEDPDAWRGMAERHSGSWWEDWAAWSSQRAGGMIKPPKMGNRKYKVLGDAPGTYVHGDVVV